MKHLQRNIKQECNPVVDIFEKHYNTLIFFGRNLGADKVLIEDCIQDLFLKFCENESLILGAHNPQAYLKSSLRRELLKKMDKKVTHLDASANVLEISVPSYEELLINQQSSLQESLSVKEALSQLSKSQKTIMTMRFYRSMSYEDIAAKLGITKRTVYNQVHDAMKKMKANFS